MHFTNHVLNLETPVDPPAEGCAICNVQGWLSDVLFREAGRFGHGSRMYWYPVILNNSVATFSCVTISWNRDASSSSPWAHLPSPGAVAGPPHRAVLDRGVQRSRAPPLGQRPPRVLVRGATRDHPPPPTRERWAGARTTGGSRVYSGNSFLEQKNTGAVQKFL